MSLTISELVCGGITLFCAGVFAVCFYLRRVL